MRDHFPLMARFNAWVNERLYESPEAERRAERGAFFGSIHRTLNHLLVVDRLWAGRIEGRDHGTLTLDQILYQEWDALLAARRAMDRDLIELVDRPGEADLDRPVRYRRITGEGQEEVRLGRILLTLFNHQTHHRGQIHALLTQSGILSPPLDLIFFLDEIGMSGPEGTLIQG